jgi:hypothetical protein
MLSVFGMLSPVSRCLPFTIKVYTAEDQSQLFSDKFSRITLATSASESAKLIVMFVL